MGIADLLTTGFAAALTLPALVYAVESFAALFGRSSVIPAPAGASTKTRFAVLVPAHDEASVIGTTLDGLKTQTRSCDRIVVVADNCTDRTAAVARERGVEVSERQDPGRRGKGFAVAHGVEWLAADPPDVVIIVDADSQVGGEGLVALAGAAADLQRPVQAEYTIQSPEGAGGLAQLSAFALRVRNRVRPLGLHVMGLPTHLMGCGMAFPWTQIRDAPPLRDNLVEDLALGIALAEHGHPAFFLPAVKVWSELPERGSAAMSQRRRWEHGQLSTLLRHGPGLVVRGLVERRTDLVALGLDLLTPPLTLLLILLLVTALLTTLGNAFGLSPLPAALSTLGLALVGLATFSSWWAFGRDVVSLATLALVPLYVLWKLPLYAAFLWQRQRIWVRTERPAEQAPPPDPT